jgi:hypothetical protein
MSGLWAYCERTEYRQRNVSVTWSEKRAYSRADFEYTVCLLWAYCERAVSVTRAECARTVIGEVSVTRADFEHTDSGLWVYRELIVSVTWTERWAYRERIVSYWKRTVSVPWAYCERTVSLLWVYPYRRTTQISSNSVHFALYSVQCSSQHAFDFEWHVWRTPLQQKHPFPHIIDRVLYIQIVHN